MHAHPVLMPAALDRTEAARYLSISPKSLDRLADSGRIERRYVGRKPLYRVADLEGFLAAAHGGPGDTAAKAK